MDGNKLDEQEALSARAAVVWLIASFVVAVALLSCLLAGALR